jgi:hypothetical protein
MTLGLHRRRSRRNRGWSWRPRTSSPKTNRAASPLLALTTECLHPKVSKTRSPHLPDPVGPNPIENQAPVRRFHHSPASRRDHGAPLLAVIKCIYLLPKYLYSIQDIEYRCLLLMSSTSFVDLPLQEHRMTEKHHMEQNPYIY